MAQPDRHWYAEGGALVSRPKWTSSPVETYVLTAAEMERILSVMREKLDTVCTTTNAGD